MPSPARPGAETLLDDSPAQRLGQALARQALSAEPDARVRDVCERLAEICGPSLDGAIFFGSRLTGAARANAWSAYDLFAVVPAYRPFFEALAAAGSIRRSPGILAWLGGVLPPTQISLRLPGSDLHVKVSVIRGDVLSRETSSRRRDHFTAGRLFQPVRILHARNDAARRAMLAALESACRETARWAGPWLPPEFDVETYGREALAVSMSWEVRPEPAGRAAVLWAAQREAQLPVLTALLLDLEARGELIATSRDPLRFRFDAPPGPWQRLRSRLFFSRSLVRATARWSKHVVTFDGWLDYIVRKASRHTGQTIDLSARERRWPLVFLWGRVFRYLWQKNRKGSGS